MKNVWKNGSFSNTVVLNDGESVIDVILQNGFYDPLRLTPDMHNHPIGEFYVPIASKVVIWVNESNVTLQRGEVCYIAPQVYHRLDTMSESGGVVRFNVDFSGISKEGKGPFCLLYQTLEQTIDYRVDSFALAPKIIELCLEASCTWHVELMTIGCMTAFFGGLSAVANAAREEENPDRSETQEMDFDIKTKISWYFTFNYTTEPSVESLARWINYSVRQTERVVHAIYGKTFSQVLTESRIRKTLQYLRDSTLTLGEIAALAGYRSYKGDCCAFRKQRGFTPSEYRKRLGEIENRQ